MTTLAQVSQPYNNGEKIILEKIDKYKSVDTLNYYSPIIANRENRDLEYEVLRAEGDISINNIDKRNFGSGGLTVYKFVLKQNKKRLKIEYSQTKHIYKDSELKEYLNSEVHKISIFFNDDDKPDFAKIVVTQYEQDKVISSQLNYLNLLADEQNYYRSLETESLINYITKIVSAY